MCSSEDARRCCLRELRPCACPSTEAAAAPPSPHRRLLHGCGVGNSQRQGGPKDHSRVGLQSSAAIRVLLRRLPADAQLRRGTRWGGRRRSLWAVPAVARDAPHGARAAAHACMPHGQQLQRSCVLTTRSWIRPAWKTCSGSEMAEGVPAFTPPGSAKVKPAPQGRGRAATGRTICARAPAAACGPAGRTARQAQRGKHSAASTARHHSQQAPRMWQACAPSSNPLPSWGQPPLSRPAVSEAGQPSWAAMQLLSNSPQDQVDWAHATVALGRVSVLEELSVAVEAVTWSVAKTPCRPL